MHLFDYLKLVSSYSACTTEALKILRERVPIRGKARGHYDAAKVYPLVAFVIVHVHVVAQLQ